MVPLTQTFKNSPPITGQLPPHAVAQPGTDLIPSYEPASLW